MTVSHMGDKIMNHFGDGSKLGVSIQYYNEITPLGNAGALFKLREQLGEAPFLLLNADAVFDVDFNRMVRFHQEHSGLVTLFTHPNNHPYYGKEGFKAVHEYLVNGGKSCMAGFVLKNTLSDNGGVTRGICKMDEKGNLTEVVETKNIVKTATGAETDGVAVDVNSLVSMNMWGLTSDFLDVLEQGFKEFFEKEVPGQSSESRVSDSYLYRGVVECW